VIIASVSTGAARPDCIADADAESMGTRRHGQDGALAPPHLPENVVKCFVHCKTLRRRIFMHYFHHLSSAFGIGATTVRTGGDKFPQLLGWGTNSLLVPNFLAVVFKKQEISQQVVAGMQDLASEFSKNFRG